MTKEHFFNLANNYGICLTQEIYDKLYTYFEFLVEYNSKVNLTSITQEDDVFVKHFLDSMLAINKIPKNASVCDVGTGAGFPGVVLKLVRDDISLTLIDSLNKRVVFLKELCERLGINATFFHLRAEEAGRNPFLRDSFDVVVSRAVANLNTLYEYALPLVKVNGVFIAYKAIVEEELEKSKHVPHLLSSSLKEVVSLSLLPNNEIRNLVIVKKNNLTKKEYPRGKNKERDNPLI